MEPKDGGPDRIAEWLGSGEYLPKPLRDFHDQKDIFKAIHQAVAVDKHEYAKSVSWIAGQCYVIDIFLWWMAKRGYTLQKSRMPFQFNDLDADVKGATNARNSLVSSLVAERERGR